MTRDRLPDRRQGVTEILIHRRDQPGEVEFSATFNWEEGGKVREVFCLAFKEGTDLQCLLHHVCISLSLGLQHGATMADYAHALGEEDRETPPTSILGLLVRAGVVIDEQLVAPHAAKAAAE